MQPDSELAGPVPPQQPELKLMSGKSGTPVLQDVAGARHQEGQVSQRHGSVVLCRLAGHSFHADKRYSQVLSTCQ